MLVPTVALALAAGIALYGAALQAFSGDGLVHPGLRNASAIARESAGRLLILTIGVAGRFEPEPRPGSGTTEPLPVLMIPGYGTNRTVFWFLQAFLAHRGWRWLWAVNHAGKEVELDGQARLLGRRVDRLLEITGADQVDLVGFSMGGLVAAWYIGHGGAPRVRRLVTIGTPWAGTRFATLARAAAGAQLGPGSAALEGLDPTRVPTTAIWSPDDPVVIPASSAAPLGSQAVRVDGVGHLDMMLNARVFRAVQQALSQGSP